MNKHQFFESMEQQGVALTYDDVRMRTGPSEVSPTDIDISTNFSRNIKLNAPVVSAAMDTVTESEMAIAMAKLGGLGVIHAAMTPEAQRTEVRKVKLHLNGLIENPITYHENQSLADVLEDCEQRDFDFRSFPVVNDDNKMVGIITGRAFEYSEDKSNDTVGLAMRGIEDLRWAAEGTDVHEAYEIMKADDLKLLPILDDSGEVAGLYVMQDVLRVVRGNPDNYALDKNGRLLVAAAVPTDKEDAKERIDKMRDYLDVVVLDTAQGDSKYAFKTLKFLKETYKDLDIVVGNVSEGESAARLALEGADGVKVGQGPGSICTTRIETGIGCPQVTAIYECVKAIKSVMTNNTPPVCADGGISNPGDIPIAIAAGAHTVMMGSRLAGTKEAPGEVIQLSTGALAKLYRGMGSPSALRESIASQKRYSASGNSPLAEGIESYIPYKGSVVEPVDHYIKALRKGMSYVGAPDVNHHRENTKLWRITNAGIRESHPHDVIVK